MLISSYWALVHNDGLHLVKIKHAIAQLMCTLSYGWQLQWNPVYPHDFFIWLPVTKKIHSYVRKLKIYIIVLWFSAVSKAKSNLSCYIDDVELIRTNWCSNQKKKRFVHSPAFNLFPLIFTEATCSHSSFSLPPSLARKNTKNISANTSNHKQTSR